MSGENTKIRLLQGGDKQEFAAGATLDHQASALANLYGHPPFGFGHLPVSASGDSAMLVQWMSLDLQLCAISMHPISYGRACSTPTNARRLRSCAHRRHRPSGPVDRASRRPHREWSARH